MAESGDWMVDVLRDRVMRGIQSGAFRSGERLPSSRQLATEFDVDYRVVLAAYKALEREGLVALRPRGGVYVAERHAGNSGAPPLPESWLVDVLTQGLGRQIPAPELAEWVRRAVETLRLAAFVVTSTEDQAYGLCSELRRDFGMSSDFMVADDLRRAAGPPLSLRRADLIVTTSGHAEWTRVLGGELAIPVIVIDVRPELLDGEWAQLLRRPVYAVVASPEFGDMLRDFYAHVPGIENLHVLVLGRDELAEIPQDAPTYVTQRARAQLGETRIRGRILPVARTIATESAREIFTFIVRSNVEAMARLHR